MLREIDTRTIAGNGGTVTLYDRRPTYADFYTVAIDGPNGEYVARIECATTKEALDAFLHPFARPDVPDIFARAE